MKGTSKLVMGATLVMVVSLAVVLALVVVLLAELYCSLLLRKRRVRTPTTTFTSTATTTNTDSLRPVQNLSGPLSGFYAQGVLQAPRRLLFPTITSEEEEGKEKEQVLFPLQREPKTTQHCISIPNSSTSPFLSRLAQPIEGVTVEGSSSNSSDCGEHLVYISNPIFDGEGERSSKVGTPFETPDTSPSRLAISSSSGSSPSSLPMSTPPLSPMKKLPSEACSVSMRDARSLGTSGSGSETNNCLSSSSSGSPRTSPSW